MFRFDRTNIQRLCNSLQIFNIILTILSMNYIVLSIKCNINKVHSYNYHFIYCKVLNISQLQYIEFLYI